MATIFISGERSKGLADLGISLPVKHTRHAMLLLALLGCVHAATAQEAREPGAADVSADPAMPVAERVDYERDVQPILEKHCYECHGPSQQEGNLRLDVRKQAYTQGNWDDPPVIPGNSKDSLLIQFVSGEGELIMPPPDTQPALTDDQVDLLRRWIDTGAAWPDDLAGGDEGPITTDHWSFQPLARVTPPVVSAPDFFPLRNEIDHYIVAALAEKGLMPSQAADPVTMIRRLYLDMHGLLPERVQVAVYGHAPSEEAYERLVEEVLASPHYGERWARHWLDVVRFGESNGFETNRDRKNAYHYRDYVIDSLNRDKSYRDFIIEQLAGDATGVDEATGFLVGGPVDIVKSPDINLTLMQREDELADYVNTTATTFLGLTVGCARCHNHKFDPILQRDYYAMQAIFAGVEHGERRLHNHADSELKASLREAGIELSECDQQLDQLRLVNGEELEDEFISRLPEDEAESARRLLKKTQTLRSKVQKLEEKIPLAYAGQFKEPKVIHRLYRGDPLSPREEVPPDTLTVMGKLDLSNDTPEQQRRLKFAQWIASEENTLTARVIVNRVWHYHFGQGLVTTPSDFGRNGSTPSHPELLDWLAERFMANNWSLKWLHRQILMSSTYRQSSQPRAEALAVDAGCTTLWRFPPRRLEAEAIRDCVLQVSGKLDRTAGGPGFLLFKIDRENVHHYFPLENFEVEHFRRMIYMTKIRLEQDDVFGSFDCPDAGQASPRRNQSTTALQALNLLNSPFMIHQAEFLAERLNQLAADRPHEQVGHAFELLFSRSPTDNEMEDAVNFIQEHGLSAFCRAILNASEFLYLS